MRFLISNDDGIDAPGLAALEAATAHFGTGTTVAPGTPQSAMSHAVTMDIPLRVEARGTNRWAIFGTPADCARVGLIHFAKDAQWVLSGINHGGNLGADVHYSGTVAAVREAALHGWPGIAFSHFRKAGMEFDWVRAGRWVERVLALLLIRPVEPGLFFNVNFPHLRADEPEPEIVSCPLDPHPLPLSYSHHDTEGFRYDGTYHLRKRAEGADVAECFGGKITVSEVRLF